MHRPTIIALLSSLIVSPVLADPAAQLPSTSLAAQAQATDFKADFTAEPALSVMGDGGDPFAQGKWIWTFYGGAAFGDEAGELYTLHLGAGYHLIDDLSINFEGVLTVADGDQTTIISGVPTRDAVGGGLDIIFRWHFLRSGDFSVYAEAGCGIVAFDREFPGHGTNVNFTPQAGVGVTYEINSSMMLMAGARWSHLSNARTQGANNNPGMDSAMVYAGIMWPF